jgi:hypothetical protein
MTETQALQALAALAQATRLRAFRELVLSFHLKELSQAGLVSSERAGRHFVYRAEFASMNDLLAYLTAHCCQGQPCELSTVACECEDLPSSAH